jgi:hypothetical protein
MRFDDGFYKRTAENVVQISEKVHRKPWQWLDKRSGREHEPCTEISNSPRTINARQVKSKVNSMLIILWHQGDCSQRIHPGKPSSQFRVLLWRFTAIDPKCVKNSLRTLATKELAVASRQRTASLHQGFLFIFCWSAKNGPYARKGSNSMMMVASGPNVSFDQMEHQSQKLWMTPCIASPFLKIVLFLFSNYDSEIE